MSRDPMDEYLRNIGAEPDNDEACRRCAPPPVQGDKVSRDANKMPVTDDADYDDQGNLRPGVDHNEQQPFVPEVTDDQIIGLARVLHGTGDVTVDHEGGVLHRFDNGASVAAEIFVSRAHIEQLGAYVPNADDDEILYAPGPAMAHMMEQAHGTFVDDIKRGCAKALAEHEEPKEPLWERLATSTITLICMGVICFYLGHGAGYKEGVHDVVAPIATALKVEQ